MACRCTDIDLYEADIKTLKEVMKKISELNAKDEEVDESLTSIADAIPDTLIVADETFCYNMKCLNNDSKGAITIMYTHANNEKEKVEELLDAAKSEDWDWHLAHPIETIKSWFD